MGTKTSRVTVRNRLIALLLDRTDHEVNGVSKLFHSLQTASRARNDGRDNEYIFCCLFHDVMGGLCPENHAHATAEVLKPYISEAWYEILYHHDEIQLENWQGIPHVERSEPWWKATVEFCDKYDFPAFDPDYPTADLDSFMPIIREFIK